MVERFFNKRCKNCDGASRPAIIARAGFRVPGPLYNLSVRAPYHPLFNKPPAYSAFCVILSGALLLIQHWLLAFYQLDGPWCWFRGPVLSSCFIFRSNALLISYMISGFLLSFLFYFFFSFSLFFFSLLFSFFFFSILFFSLFYFLFFFFITLSLGDLCHPGLPEARAPRLCGECLPLYPALIIASISP